jgi:hypothetical protein
MTEILQVSQTADQTELVHELNALLRRISQLLEEARSLPTATTAAEALTTEEITALIDERIGVFEGTEFELTSGSVVFFDGDSFAEDNDNLFWDDSNNRLGIGTSSPSQHLEIVGDGSSTILARFQQSSASSFAQVIARNTASAATDNYCGFDFQLESDSTTRTAASVRMRLSDIADATRTGAMEFTISNGGSFDQMVTFDGSNVAFNGQTTWGTNAAGVIAIKSGTAPISSPADALQVWVGDRGATAGKAGLHWRAEDATVGVLSDRFGFGTATPTEFFQTTQTSAGSRVIGLSGRNTGATASTEVSLVLDNGGWGAGVWTTAISSLRTNSPSNGSQELLFYTNSGGVAGTEKLRIDASGNLGLNQTSFGSSAAAVLAIGSGTAPSSSPADSAQIWVEDKSGAGTAELKYRMEDGTTGFFTDLGGGGGDFSDGGDTAGADRTLGNNDNFDLGFETNGLTRIHVQSDGLVGFGGLTTPQNQIHTWTSTATETALINVEQDGTGDAAMSFEITGAQTWIMGADNSNSDMFAISSSGSLSTNIRFTLDTSGNFGLGANQWGTSAVRVLSFQAGTAPTSVIGDTVQFWTADHNGAAGECSLHYLSESSQVGMIGTRVGFGTVTPGQYFEVDAGSDNSIAKFKTTGNGGFEIEGNRPFLDWIDKDDVNNTYRVHHNGGEGTYPGTLVFQFLDGVTNPVRGVLDSSGNWGFNTPTEFGSGVLVMGIANATSVPTANPSGGGVLYADGGAGKWRGSSGTTTTFGPADPHCPECGKDFVLEWQNDEFGHLVVCMWCATEGFKKGLVKRGR